MKLQNLLNLKAIDVERPIYRIVPCNQFLQMLRDKKNGLVLPRKWRGDPFENFILEGVAVMKDGMKVRIGFRDSLYGQCWTLHKESDLMWRAYAPNKDGIKLESNIGSLFQSLYSTIREYCDLSCFIGKVKYISRYRIGKVLKKVTLLDPSCISIAETLLIKRWAFSSEKEIRLIYFNHDKSFTEEVYQYNIDPNMVFIKAVLDPRMKDRDAEMWKTKFKSEGFYNKIIQSALYKPPQKIFININA